MTDSVEQKIREAYTFQESLGTCVLIRALAQQPDIRSGKFLASLIHDLGGLLLVDNDRDAQVEIFEPGHFIVRVNDFRGSRDMRFRIAMAVAYYINYIGNGQKKQRIIQVMPRTYGWDYMRCFVGSLLIPAHVLKSHLDDGDNLYDLAEYFKMPLEEIRYRLDRLGWDEPILECLL